MSPTPTFFTRKKKLVQSRLQVRMTTAFFVLSALGLCLQAFLVKRAIEAAAVNVEGAAPLLEELPTLLWTNLLLTLCAVIPVIAMVGIFLTHRVAGPASRLESYLRDWIAGKWDGPCQLRKGDDLHELCELVNEALHVASEEAGREVGAERSKLDAA